MMPKLPLPTVRFASLFIFQQAFLNWRRITFLILLMVFTLNSTGCILPASSPTSPTTVPVSPPESLPEATATFRVKLPGPLSPGETLNLTILDEVTGLALNPKSYVMEAEDAVNYSVVLPFPVHSVLKYRYTRQGATYSQEHQSDGRPVRYRLLLLEGPCVVEDTVSRWTDTEFDGPTGRISGIITQKGSKTPVPGILVTAGGSQTITASDGSYLLEGLPTGTHNLVAYALDGAYQVYQQGARVAIDSTTPASMQLQLATMVKVVFKVTVPQGTVQGVPPRLAGNLYQLGNTFADLSGGISTVSSHMPVLNILPDGSFTTTLDLPAGADIRYKYTYGDGLWNAEHFNSGAFRVRQLIVPNESIIIEDHVETWSAGKSAPITFDVQVPENTPAEEIVSIQFNPKYGWTEPLPMWQVEPKRWLFVLYSPLDTLGSIVYRYCRNDQCGSADDVRTAGLRNAGHSINSTLLPQTVDDPIVSWQWLMSDTPTIVIPNTPVQERSDGFWAGVELQQGFHPSWGPRFNTAFADIASLNANWVTLRPSWTFTRLNYPVLEPVPGQDPLWIDLNGIFKELEPYSMNVALFPTPRFPLSSDQWWETGERNFAWWVVWFERYRTFALHFADLAASQNAEALVLGGEWILPALPDGQLADGAPSGVPMDAESRWRTLLNEVRQHYNGQILWALPYSDAIQPPPAFIDEVDQIYVLWSAPLAQSSGTTAEELAVRAGELLDEELQPLAADLRKPVILALSYPSADGALQGCIRDDQGDCLRFEALSRPNPDIASVTVDLNEQVDAYNAMLQAINDRDWIDGIVACGYYPAANLADKSTSIHGKPSRGVLWYWFPRLLGITPP